MFLFIYLFYVPVSDHTGAAGLNRKKGALVSLTRTGACRVLAEVLSREQERDLQGSEGQEAALVGKVQEVKTCEGNDNVFVFTELHAEKYEQRGIKMSHSSRNLCNGEELTEVT